MLGVVKVFLLLKLDPHCSNDVIYERQKIIDDEDNHVTYARF